MRPVLFFYMYIATPHALEGGMSRECETPLNESRQHVDVDNGPYGSRLKGPDTQSTKGKSAKGRLRL